jgi:glutathione S-transferase
MTWVTLVALLALLQFMVFLGLVGWARGRYGVHAPAVAGNETFERYFRVQQNTLECLIMFLPALFIAEHYWDPNWIAAIGAVYLVGRVVYLRSYVRNPKQRTLGYAISVLPILILVIAGFVGVFRTLLAGTP